VILLFRLGILITFKDSHQNNNLQERTTLESQTLNISVCPDMETKDDDFTTSTTMTMEMQATCWLLSRHWTLAACGVKNIYKPKHSLLANT
jgi:hypothetical protein